MDVDFKKRDFMDLVLVVMGQDKQHIKTVKIWEIYPKLQMEIK
jgi:hypothetical protein